VGPGPHPTNLGSVCAPRETFAALAAGLNSVHKRGTMRVLKAFLVSAGVSVVPFSFFVAACSGGSNGPSDGGSGSSSGGSSSGVHHPPPDGGSSSGGSGGGSSGGAMCSLAGSQDLAVKVQNFFPAGPVAGAWVRAESAAGCAEAQTGADGIAHVMVDMAKGPYDVTVAGDMAMLPGDAGAPTAISTVSILGVTTAPLTGAVQVSPQASVMNFGMAAIKGNVTVPGNLQVDAGGADGGTYRVFIDAWDFITVVQAAALPQYSTQYQYDPSHLPGIPIPLAGMLVDPNDQIISGVYTAQTPRTGNAMGVNVDFTMNPLTPTTTTINIQWPSAGVVTPAQLNMIGNPAGNNASIGNAIVVKLTNMEASAEQFCGIGTVTLPDANGKSTFTLQAFPNTPMAPDIAEAVLFGNQYAALVQPHNLMNGATETVGQVNMLTTTPGSNGDLSDVQFSVDGMGYDATVINIWNGKAQSPVTYWTIYATGSTLMNRKLPNLPSAVSSTNVISVAQVTAYTEVVKYRQGAPPPWAAVSPDIEQELWDNKGQNLMATGK